MKLNTLLKFIAPVSSSLSIRGSLFNIGLIKSLRSPVCTIDNTAVCNVIMVNVVRADVEDCDENCIYISPLQCSTTEFTEMTRKKKRERQFCSIKNKFSTHFEGDRNSSAGIATRYRLEGPGIEPWWGRDFPYPSITSLGPTQPPIQWLLDRFPGGKAAWEWR